MTHVILGHCCKDASCVRACPQNCIHPAPGEPGFATTETLHIDPRTCIDCTACVTACPASAIKAERDLDGPELRFALLNAEYFRDRPVSARVSPIRDLPGTPLPMAPSRIAVVGAGPAALYAVRELLRRSGAVRVTVFDRDDEIGGLLRRGVARTETGVREMIRLFAKPFGDDRVRVVLGADIGVDRGLDELRAEFDGVVLACGASEPRSFPGADRLSGFHQAVHVLAADNCGLDYPLGASGFGPECVVIGAGNVALDFVRHAAGRGVRRLTVLSRSRRVAFTPSAFYALTDSAVPVAADADGAEPDAGHGEFARALAALPRHAAGARDGVLFSFGSEAARVDAGPSGLCVTTTRGRSFRADAVVGAAGFRVHPIDGVPLTERGTIPHRSGRVIDPATGAPLPGLYVTGWAKRGPTGGVGDNRACAAETVAALAADLTAALAR